jgi:hypothetical protein
MATATTTRPCHLSLSEAQALAERLCENFGVPPVSVEYRDDNREDPDAAWYECVNKKIVLYPLCGYERTLVHEVAHHIQFSKYGRPVQHHGKQFFAILSEVIKFHFVDPKLYEWCVEYDTIINRAVKQGWYEPPVFEWDDDDNLIEAEAKAAAAGGQQ